MRSFSRFFIGASGIAAAAALLSPAQSSANESRYGANRDVGYEVYQLQQKIRETENRVSSLENELAKMKTELARLHSQKTPSPQGSQHVSYQGNKSTPTPPPSGGGFYHQVERGDTLSSISRRYQVGIDRLVASNRIANPHALRIGQEILIPGASSSSSSSRQKETAPPSSSRNSSQQKTGYYTVRSGDTLYGIARKHGTTIDAIVGMNQVSNPNALQIGQQLKVPGASGSPAPSPSSSSNRGSGSKSSPPSGGSSGSSLQNDSADSGDMIKAPPGHGFYQVEKGDSLTSIAVSFETTTSNLRQLNKLKSVDDITVGQYLLVPVPDESLYED